MHDAVHAQGKMTDFLTTSSVHQAALLPLPVCVTSLQLTLLWIISRGDNQTPYLSMCALGCPLAIHSLCGSVMALQVVLR